MNYEQVQKLSGEDFRRLTGVKRETFLMMAEILMQEYEIAKKNHKYRGGRNPALSIKNKLLLVFTYLREYSSMFHTAQKFEVVVIDATESPCERPKKTEKILFWQEKKAHIEAANRDLYS